MISQCYATMAPNYVFAMNLACSFTYSVYFMPFNEVSTRQLITLNISKKQKAELLLFLANTALALFLFGGKRPNATIPAFYSAFIFVVYVGWCFIFLLELLHVLQIRAAQRRRQLSLVTAQRDILEHVKSLQSHSSSGGVMSDLPSPPINVNFPRSHADPFSASSSAASSSSSSSSFRPLSLQVPTSRVRHNPSQGSTASTADFERWLAASRSVTSRDGSVPRDVRDGSVPRDVRGDESPRDVGALALPLSAALSPADGSVADGSGTDGSVADGARALTPTSSPPSEAMRGSKPPKPLFKPPPPPPLFQPPPLPPPPPPPPHDEAKRESEFQPPSRPHRAMSESITHDLKAFSKSLDELKASQKIQGEETETALAALERSGKELPLKYARPIRGFLAFFPFALAVASLLIRAELTGSMRRRLVLAVWAVWPFCAMCIGTLFISSFSKTKVGVYSESIFFFIGGPCVWVLTDAFNFEWALKSTRNRVLLDVAIVIVSGVLYCVVFLLRLRIRRMCDDETIYGILENSFTTFASLTLPVVYLSLESVGWICFLGLEDEALFSSSRSVVKVNFLACMHLFGVLIYSLYFSFFSRYDGGEILRGRLSRRITSEVALFILATAICLFSLATKVTGRTNFGSEAPSTKSTNSTGESILDSFHVALGFIFLFCWWGIFILEGIWHFHRLNPTQNQSRTPMSVESQSVIEMHPSRTTSLRATAVPNGSMSSDNASSCTESSRETIMSLSPQVLSPLWRYAAASVPVIFVPFTAICWLLFSPSTAPFVYLFISAVPINILCAFVVMFSQPSLNGSTWLELTAYLLGGPISNLLGCLADIRWSYAYGENGLAESGPSRFGRASFANFGPLVFVVLRFIFTVLLLGFTKLLLRFRLLIAENVRDVDKFVVYAVCGSAISAFAPASYICLTSLGCVISTYELNNYTDIIVSPLCMQQLTCNVGVATHICGVAMLNIFFISEFVDYGMEDIIAFTIPRHVKIDFLLLTIATFFSLTLYSWKFFVPNDDFKTQMLIIVGAILAAVLILWGIVLIRQVLHVTRKVASAKVKNAVGTGNSKKSKSVFASSASDLSGSSENSVNIDFITGKSHGVSGFAPGLG